jgi:hypothetical protein
VKPRPVDRIVAGQEASEGAGVRIRRLIGAFALSELDPFLLLDEFKSDRPDDYLAGFPDHPHRGFETVTYMIDGAMEHRDHKGNHGLLGPGSVQWMTAGRGIIHSEMPRQRDGLMWGYQLWVNLPAADKMTEPRYQDIQAGAIPERADGDARVRVIAGRSRGVEGAVKGIATAPLYLDVALPGAARFEEDVPEGHTAMACVVQGTVAFGDRQAAAGQLAVFGDGDRVLGAAGPDGGRFLLIAARPLREPIARYGPFVMNTREEIQQAFDDFRAGRF